MTERVLQPYFPSPSSLLSATSPKGRGKGCSHGTPKSCFFLFLENPHVLLSKKHMAFSKHLVIIADFWNCSHIFPGDVLYFLGNLKRKELQHARKKSPLSGKIPGAALHERHPGAVCEGLFAGMHRAGPQSRYIPERLHPLPVAAGSQLPQRPALYACHFRPAGKEGKARPVRLLYPRQAHPLHHRRVHLRPQRHLPHRPERSSGI